MKRLLLILIGLYLVLFFGCATYSTSTICQEAPAGSVICKIADKRDKSPEQISKIIMVGQVFLLKEKPELAENLNAFIDDCIDYLEPLHDENVITYKQVVEELQKRYKKLSQEEQMLLIIIDPFELGKYEIKVPLSDFDIDLLIDFLIQQQSIVRLYLPK